MTTMTSEEEMTANTRNPARKSMMDFTQHALMLPMLSSSSEESGDSVDSSPNNKWQHPPSFYCPISQQCMHDPVVLSDGHSYERRHIERWLKHHNTSPVSGLELLQKDLFSNHALRNAIEEYFKQVFSVHRRAIRKTLKGPDSSTPSDAGEGGLWSNALLLRTIDALVQCSLLVNADLNTESVLRQIMDEAKTLLGAEAASVFLVDAEHKELYSTVNSTGGELRIPLTVGIAGHVATHGEPVVIHDAYNDERFNKAVDVKTGFRTRNIMCVPLRGKKGIVGVVQLVNKTSSGVLAGPSQAAEAPESFTGEDLHFFQVFASQAATAVANSGELEAEWPATMTDETCSTSCYDVVTKCFGRLLSKNKTASSPKKLQLAWDKSDLESRVLEAVDVVCEPLPFECVEAMKPALEILDAGFHSWQLDTLALADATGNKPLSTLAIYLFEHLGLTQHFNLEQDKLLCFFVEIERGYHDSNPYHNRAHAASVMFAMYALLEHGGLADAVTSVFKAEGEAVDNRKQLVRMACLLSAAVHDYDHLGLSNDFLIKTAHERALRYNDQHVNENHHAAAAFAVLHRMECNFLHALPASDLSWTRRLVIDLVIGTDMVNNGKILKSCVDMLDKADRDSVGTETAFAPTSTEDATLLLQMAMKCSDLGHLALDWDLHGAWVRRLESEFFAQGDKETALGMPVSFLMDRKKPGASSTQIGFFDFVVLPLFQTLIRAAPAACPVMLSIKANYGRWRDLEAAKGLGTQASGSEVVASDHQAVSTTDQPVHRKKSGRSRQRAAKFWASVRQRTPSP